MDEMVMNSLDRFHVFFLESNVGCLKFSVKKRQTSLDIVTFSAA